MTAPFPTAVSLPYRSQEASLLLYCTEFRRTFHRYKTEVVMLNSRRRICAEVKKVGLNEIPSETWLELSGWFRRTWVPILRAFP